jgi:type I restriction enzyme, S subunit
MRLYGAGPFHRELKPAMQITKKSHFVIRAGDVIYNKLFAWKGTFGVVSAQLDGMFVSDKFPTYGLDRSQVDENYLRWFFRHPDVWEQARLMSTGSAALSKLTLNPPRFLDLQIPLPTTLEEQRRIASWIETMAGTVSQAQSLRDEAREESEALNRSGVSSILQAYPASGKLADILKSLPRNGWSPKCDNDANGVAVLILSAVTGWRYDPKAVKRTSLPTNPGAHYWLTEGDLLITRSNAPDLVGHVSIYSGQPSPCIYPDLIMKIIVDPSKAYTPFVWHWMQTTIVRDYIKRSAKGTSPIMRKISQGIVAGTPFPTAISVSEQRRIVNELDALRARIDAVKQLQDGTAVELAALMPAILDRAFPKQSALKTVA